MNDGADRGSPIVDDTVTQEWQEERLPTIFAKWNPFMEPASRSMTEAIIAEAGVRSGYDVIDIACGAGIPSLALAEVVGPDGSVTATDPSPILIAAVRANAQERGVTNLRVVQVSAAGLDFPAGGFDAATCKFGVMFFPDVKAGLERIRSVLRPGRRAAFVAWGPALENGLFGPFRQVALAYVSPDKAAEMAQEPPPDAPTPMRFARSGSLSAELRAAGYNDVREQAIKTEFNWPGTATELVNLQCEVTGLEESIAVDRHKAFRRDAEAAYEKFKSGPALRLPVSIVLASGAA